MGNELAVFIGLDKDLFIWTRGECHPHRKDDIVAIEVLLLVKRDLENLTGLDQCLGIHGLDCFNQRPSRLNGHAQGDQPVVQALALGQHDGAVNRFGRRGLGNSGDVLSVDRGNFDGAIENNGLNPAAIGKGARSDARIGAA
jgi:hypothetical protein